MTLSKRLQAISEMLAPHERVTDVGTDHGHLPIELARRGFSGLIVTDLNAAPLEKARKNAAAAGVEALLSFRLCDGLNGVSPDETDAVVVAGLSAGTISDVIARAPWLHEKKLVLQPMSRPEELRRFLCTNEYAIFEEKLVCEEGRFFPVLRVGGGRMMLTPAREAAGPCPTREYLDRLIRINEEALIGLKNSSKPADAPRLAEISALLEELRKL